LAVVFLAEVFLAAVFFVAVFLGAVFFGELFFLAVVFLLGVFLVVVFLAAVFFAAVFLSAVFLVEAGCAAARSRELGLLVFACSPRLPPRATCGSLAFCDSFPVHALFYPALVRIRASTVRFSCLLSLPLDSPKFNNE
jgi:hypothetical protein